MAIQEGIRLAVEKGYNQVIIESDSQVNLCNVDDDNHLEIRSICQKIREISRALTSVSIVFAGREANMAAHLCAKQASIDRKRCLWINYNPCFPIDTLRSDCNPIS
jgi:hypothetical protein